MSKQLFVTENEIQESIKTLAQQINKDYDGVRSITAICILKGGVMFFTDLVKHITVPIQFEFIHVNSYIGCEKSDINISKNLKKSAITDHDVLLIDDICDSGQTLQQVIEELKQFQPGSIKTCVLFDHPKNPYRVDITPDYVAIDKELSPHTGWLIGYGLDNWDYERNIPYVSVLDKDGDE